MSLNALTLIGLQNLVINENIGRGIRLADGLFLCNDSEVIQKFITPYIRESVGTLDMKLFATKGRCFIYSTERDRPDHQDTTVLEELDRTLFEIGLFLRQLWLIRDNCAYLDCGVRVRYKQSPLESPLVSQNIAKNYLGSHVSMSSGQYNESVSFSAREIRELRPWYDLLLQQTRRQYTNWPTSTMQQHNPATLKISPVERFLGQIDFARREIYTSLRIAQYMTALESLFSTDSSELVYRLSERVAFFLGESSKERKQIFLDIKSAYKVRSAVVHGDIITKSLSTPDQLSNMSRICDHILRRCFWKIVYDEHLLEIFWFKSDKKAIDDYFATLVFGVDGAVVSEGVP